MPATEWADEHDVVGVADVLDRGGDVVGQRDRREVGGTTPPAGQLDQDHVAVEVGVTRSQQVLL